MTFTCLSDVACVYICIKHSIAYHDARTCVWCVHINVHSHTHTHTSTSPQMKLHRHTHTLSLSFSLTHIHAYTHTRTHTCTHTYSHAYIHTHIHDCVHTYIFPGNFRQMGRNGLRSWEDISQNTSIQVEGFLGNPTHCWVYRRSLENDSMRCNAKYSNLSLVETSFQHALMIFI